MAPFLSTYFLVLISAQLVKSSAVFELKLRSFTTSSNSSVCQESSDCQAFVRVCLNHTQDVTSNKLSCSTGTGSIATLITDKSSISTCVPITVPFDLKWLGEVSVTIEASTAEFSNDQPTENVNMIGHAASKINVTFGKKWSQNEHHEEQNELRFFYRVVCNKFYSGDCSKKTCRSRGDIFGHFNCDALGNKICMSGWKGEHCTEPICLSGCSKEHGSCVNPGECKCRYGWKGPLCDECIPYPGCLHGTCKTPWDCTCKEGWGGLLCTHPLNV